MAFIKGFGCVLSLVSLLSTGPVLAERLTFYCSAQEDWCQLMARSFEEETGIDVDMTRKSTGETYAQIRAEASNPKGDIWWGGTGDPHLQAALEGLTAEYISPMRGELQDWAISQAETSGNRTVGIYSGALGFGYNTELLDANDCPARVLGGPSRPGLQGTKSRWRTRTPRAPPTPCSPPWCSSWARTRPSSS